MLKGGLGTLRILGFGIPNGDYRDHRGEQGSLRSNCLVRTNLESNGDMGLGTTFTPRDWLNEVELI